ncbi:MAG: beta-propeller fold lactonase family protein [Acidobacteriota bacterium]
MLRRVTAGVSLQRWIWVFVACCFATGSALADVESLRSDLSVEKINCSNAASCAATELSTVVPGAAAGFTYQVTVTNDGIHPVFGATVSDPLPAAFSPTSSWSCSASPSTSSGEIAFVDVHSGATGARDVLISPDGAFVYVAEAGNDRVSVWSRDALSGSLTFSSSLAQSDLGSGEDGLDGPAALAFSSDASYLFVAAEVGDTIAAFARNSGTGVLTYSDHRTNGAMEGSTTIIGLEGARGVAVTSDDAFVLVAAGDSDAVASLSFSAGSLTWESSLADGAIQGVNIVDGLNGARGIDLSSDDAFAYVAAGDDDSVSAFAVSSADGSLTWLQSLKDNSVGGTVPQLNGAHGVLVGPSGSQVYVAADVNDAVSWFSRDSGTGLLTFVDDIQESDAGVSGLEGAAGLAVDDAGGHLFVASQASDALAVLARDGSGALSFVQAVTDGDSLGSLTVDGLDEAIAVAFYGGSGTGSDLGDHVVAVGATDNAVSTYLRDIASSCSGGLGSGNLSTSGDLAVGGSLTYQITGTVGAAETGTLSNTASAAAPTGYSDTAGSANAGCDGDADNDSCTDSDALIPSVDLEVVGFTSTPTSVTPGERLSYSLTVRNNGPSVSSGFLLPAPVPAELLSPVFAASDGTIQPFDRWVDLSLASGQQVTLTIEGVVSPGIDYRVTPSLDHTVTVSALGSESDPSTGNNSGSESDSLTPVGDVSITKDDGLTSVQPLQVVSYVIEVSNSGPSDLFGVRVVDDFDDTLLSAVSYTCSTGAALLTRGEAQNGIGGVDGLGSVTAVAVAPSGDFIYATGQSDHAVAVLSLASDGSLGFVESRTDGVGTLPDQPNGLEGATGVAVSPDGEHVYVTANLDHALTVFDRNGTDGTLTLVEEKIDGVSGVDGLEGAAGVVLTPDGRFLYVAGQDDDLIARFERTAASGAVSFLGTTATGSLTGVAALAMHPSGRYLYAAAPTASAVNVYAIDSASGDLTLVETELDDAGRRLGGVTAIAVSPAGDNLFASGTSEDAVVSFDIASADGSLTFRSERFAGDGGLGGSPTSLSGPVGLAVIPDGTQVVVTSPGSNSVVLFSRVGHELTFVSTQTAGEAVSTVFSPGGEFLVLADRGGSSVFSLRDTFGATCPAAGSGDLDAGVDLPAGATITIQADATVAAGATGTLVNTATATVPDAIVTDAASAHPAGVCDGAANNNECTDTDDIGILIDVQMTKLALTDPAVPGQPFQWQIVAFNAGPSAVSGARLVDDFDDTQFTAVTWTCTGSGNANAVCGTTTGSGDLDISLDLEPGFGVTVIATGELRSSAGLPCTYDASLPCMVNTAEVELPVTHLDSNGSSVTTEVELSPQGDLQIVKTAGSVDEDTGALAFEIRVKNCGPSDVVGAVVRDDFPGTYSSPTWTCAVTGGSAPETACPASGSGNINLTVDLEAGDPSDCSGAGEVTFTIDGTVSVLSGVLSNTATVTSPTGFFDPNPDNSSFVNVFLSAEADLSIIKDDGTTSAVPGETLEYSIVVSNEGPDDAFLATVEDLFPTTLTDVRWICSSEAPPRGTLTLIETEIPLETARQVAISPDGGFLYLVRSPGAVEVFERDSDSGEVTFVESRLDGVEGAGGSSDVANHLVGAAAVLVSHDGAHVLVASETDGAVTVFVRDPLDGTLTFLSERVDGIAGAGGTPNLLLGANGLALSADGDFLYVSALGNETTFAGSGITVFAFDAGTGTLSFVQEVADSAPSDLLLGLRALALAPDGENLYVTAEEDDAVSAFAIDDSSGELTFLQALDTGTDLVDGAFDLVVSPEEGRHVYVTGRLDQSIAVFQRESDGTLSSTSLSRVKGDSGEGGSAQGLEQPTGIAMSPDGIHLYVASTGDDSVGEPSSIAVYQRNQTSGSLKFIEVLNDGAASAFISGVVGLALDGDGVHLYAASVFDDSLTVWERAQAPPTFAFVDAIADTDSGADGLDGASDVLVVGDLGEHVYLASSSESAVSAWERDRDTGDLSLIEVERDDLGADGLEFPVALAATQTGGTVYVASQGVASSANGLAVFERNGTSGELTFIEVQRDGAVEGDGDTVDGLFGIAGLAVSADGRFLYAASRFAGFGGGLTVFEIVGASGELDWITTYTSGVGGIEGLQGAHDVVVTADGEHLYVAASEADAVLVFARDTVTGELTQQQVLQGPSSPSPVAGSTAIAALDRPLGLALSPDDGNLYVASGVADSLVALLRATDSTGDDFGDLSELQAATDGGVLGSSTVDGLNGARGVAVADDGKFVYVAGQDDQALAVFAREATTGSLTFLEARVDGSDGVSGLTQPYSVAVTRDTRHVYVAAFQSDSVAIFSRSSGSRCTSSGVGDLVDQVDIAAGGSVVYTISATVDPAATGSLVNTATVAAGSSSAVSDPADPHPSGICVGAADNNTCTDTDLLTPEADLEVSKSNRVDGVVPGEETTYEIEVFNRGPSNVVGGTVSDDLCRESDGACTLFEGVAQWTCVAEPSGTLDFRQALVDEEASVAGLDGAAATAIDPSGQNLYVTGLLDDAVSVFEIQGDGSLLFVESLAPAGLDGASAVTVSPDGAHVYVAARTDDALMVFSRAGDGTLTFVALFQDDSVALPEAGATVVDGLDSAAGLAFDPSGLHLYVAASNDNSVSHYSRDAGTGALTFEELVRDDVAGVDGLAGARALVATAGDVYVAGEAEDALARFTRDGTSGALSFAGLERNGSGTVTDMVEPRGLALADDGLNLYVAAAGSNALVVFSRDTSTGSLSFRQSLVSGTDAEGLTGVTALAVSADGFNVYTAATEGAVAVFRRESTAFGDLTFVERQRDGIEAEGLDGASALALTPDGRTVLVASRFDDSVAVFDRPADSSCNSGVCDPGSSGLDCALDDTIDVAAGTRLRYEVTGTVAADACAPPYPCEDELVNEVFVDVPLGTTETDSSDNRDSDSDPLSPRVDLEITKADQFVEVVGLAGAADVAIASDGAHVYAVGEVDDAVVVFERDGLTGELTFLETYRDDTDLDGLNGARAVALSPDGEHVYVAGAGDNALAVFRRDASDGTLSFLQLVQNGLSGVTALLAPSDLVVSADGSYLLVAVEGSDAVSVFARDTDSGAATFGELSQVEVYEDGMAGVDGLAGARALTLVGSDLYVSGALDQAVAHFTVATGGSPVLTFDRAWFEGADGVSSLLSPAGLSVSPDGLQLYVAATGANGVVVFSRDTATGSLTFLEARVDGDGGAGGSPDALLAPAAVLVTPDPAGADAGGQHVYVAAAGSSAVAVFARDASSGALTWIGALANGDLSGGETVASLAGVRALAFAEDGIFLYSAAATDAAVSALERDWDSTSETGSGELALVAAQSNGGGGVAPGATVNYVIRVTNQGPSAVVGARVTDIFPVELVDVSFTCSIITAGASCFGGTGDIVQDVSLPAGGIIEFQATATVRPDATGSVVNTATVEAPAGVIELDTSNDSATDDNTILTAQADLEISKINCDLPLPSDLATCTADESTTSTPGRDVAYKITVDNRGPSDASGVLVRDIFPEVMNDISWTCSATPIPGLLGVPTFSPVLFTEGDAVSLSTCGGPVTALEGLEGAAAVAVSADGRSAYAASFDDDAVALFSRSASTGALTYLGAISDGQTAYDASCSDLGTVDGLAGASDVVVDGDGSHVYVAGATDDAIAIFTRDSLTGELTFAAFVQDGDPAGGGFVDGLGGVAALALSPDGSHLYAVGRADNGLAVFAVEADGTLTFLEAWIDGVDGVDGLAGAADLAVADSGQRVYAVGSLDDAVAIFDRAGDGRLTFVDAIEDGDLLDGAAVTGLAGAAAIAVSEDGDLYIAGSTANAVAVLRDGAGGQSFIAALVDDVAGVDGLAGVASLALSGDGEHLYAGAPGEDGLAVLARAASGELTFVEALLGPADAGLAEISGLVVSSDGDQLYATAATGDSLVIYERQAGSRCDATGSGRRLVESIDLVAGGQAVFALQGTVVPSATGTLRNEATVEAPMGVIDEDPDDNLAVDENDLVPEVDLVLTKDDGATTSVPGTVTSYVITVENLGPSDLLAGELEDPLVPEVVSATWSCSSDTALTFVAAELDAVEMAGAASVLVSDDGEHAYLASPAASTISVYDRDPASGTLLGRLQLLRDGEDGIDDLAGVGGLALSADQKTLFAVAGDDDALLAFERDSDPASPDFGQLSLGTTARQSDGTLDGLDGAANLSLHPQGGFVYVTSVDDEAVAVFSWDGADLTFVEREKDGFGDVPLGVLAGAWKSAVSPDGAFLYVVARTSHALSVFAIDDASGALTFVEALQDGDAGVDGLNLLSDLVISPGGEHLYTAALGDDAVMLFERDASSGELTAVSLYRDGDAGFDSFDGANGLAISSDGQDVAVTALNDDALVVLRRSASSGELTVVATASDDAGFGLDAPADVAFDGPGGFLQVAVSASAGVSIWERRAAGVCSPSGSDALSDVIDLEVGGELVYAFDALVHPAATGSLTNTVTVEVPAPTVNSGDTSASDTNTLTPQADLAIDKDDGVTTAVPGAQVLYFITATNAGPSDDPAVQVTDSFPAEIVAVSWSCSGTDGGVCGNPSGSGDIAETVALPVGAAVTFQALATIDPAATGSLDNTAMVTSAGGSTDPNLDGREEDSDSDLLTPRADLSVVKTADVDILGPGQPFEYFLEVANGGPSVARDVEVRDVLPTGVTFGNVTGSGWFCSQSAGEVLCELASLAPGSASVITLGVASPLIDGAFTNTATVAGSGTDPVSGNDSSSVDVTVDAISPQVTLIGTDEDTADGELTSMESLRVALNRFFVTFTEELADPAGNLDPGDVTNPASYRVLAAGPDRRVDTAGCGTLVGDDRELLVTAVDWDATASVATLILADGEADEDGLYALFACAALSDLYGNALDGDGDGTGGDDFGRYFRLQRHNLLLNGDFDFDLGAWAQSLGAAGAVTFDGLRDGWGWPLSGAARLTNPEGDFFIALSQCIDTQTTEVLRLLWQGNLLAALDADVRVGLEITQFDSPGCTGSAASTTLPERTPGDMAPPWMLFDSLVVPEPDLQSLRVEIRVSTPQGDAFEVGVDSLELAPRRQIFSDGFESGNTDSWSAVTP